MRYRTLAALCLFVLTSPLLAAVTGTLMTSDGQPIAGAKVELHPFETVETRNARLIAGTVSPEPLASATSDAKGNFSLESPKELVVELRIAAGGYEPQSQRVERDEEVGALVLRKAATRTGRVTANGKPVANARVIWWASGYPMSIATTDAEGRYSAPDPKNASSVTVLHPDFAIAEETYGRGGAPTRSMDRALVAGREVKGIVYAADGKTPVAKAAILVDGWPVATSADDGTFTIAHLPLKWRSIVATSGSNLGVRRFSKDNTLTFRLERGATLRGTVRDAKGTAIPSALVRVSEEQDFAVATTVTDAKGNYSVVVPPGAYRLLFSHPSFSIDFVQTSIAGGQQQTKDARLTPYARVSGTVLDEEQRPVAAAFVGAEDVQSEPFLRFNRTWNPAWSGPDGRFTARVSPERDIRMKATKRSFPEGKSDALQLAPGERKRGMVITIPSGIEVTGRITDRDGNALSGVSVVATEAEQSSGGPMRRMIVMSREPGLEEELVTTASDGTFLIRLREGTYDFNFRASGYSAKAIRAQRVTVGAPPIETTLDPSVEIRGRVVRNGHGLEGVQVSSFTPEQQSFAITAADGSFTLADLSAGMVRLMIRKEDEFISDQRNVNAPGRDVLIEVPPGGTVSGRVIDKSSRKPVTSFQAGVSTSRSAGGMMTVAPPMLRSFTSEDGTFTLENVPTGAINLIVTAPGYAQGRKSGITLEEGKAVTDIEVELDTGVKLVGRVTGPDGSALSGVTVRESSTFSSGRVVSPTRSDARATTEANGDYALEALEPGEKTIEFSHPKYLQARKTVELKGRETRVDVKLESGARVTGTVVTDSGVAVAEARVEASGSSPMGFGNSVRSDASGNFVFESLAPGRYTFRAAKNGYAAGELEDIDISTNQNLRITLGRGGVIYGRVRGLSEAEYPFAFVEARGPEGTASSAVDATGSYRIEGAPQGTSRVSATVSRDFSARKTSQVQTVQMEAGGSQQIDLEFRSDTTIRGRITRDGRPLTGGTISFYPRNATASTNASAPVDDAGLYSVSGLEEGEYNVVINDTQRLSPYQTTYRVRGADNFDIEYRTISVRGRVIDSSTSEPLVDVRVQLKPTGQDSMFMSRGSVTDSNGSFAIDFVPAGSYQASAEKEGFATDQRPVQVSDSSAPDLDFRLTRADGIRITVVDARDRRPISAMVRATDGAGRVYESSFRLDNEAVRLAVPPGSFTVTVSAMGYAPQTLTLTAPSQQTVALVRGGTVVIRSRETSRRRGRLLGANGVHVSPSRMMSTWFPIEPGGETTVENVLPGRYSLQILGDNDAVLDQTEVTVLEGQKVTVDF
ncbi:MAG TPA: carboxypeptidase regulatory-like domain-containing protein [Thermoanaerobaculia bacterium]|jgi:hypothetical protein